MPPLSSDLSVQRVLDELPCAILSVSARGQLTFANQACRRLLGLSASGDEDWRNALTPDAARALQSMLDQQKREQTGCTQALQLANGRTVVLKLKPSGDTKGTFLGFLGSLDELALSDPHLCEAYDLSPDMQLSVNSADCLIADCNQTLLDTLSYNRDDVVGHSVFEFYTPDSAKRARDELYPEFLREGAIRGAELKVIAKDGRELTVLLNSNAVRDEAGHVVRSRSVWRDVTALRQIEAAHAASEMRLSRVIAVSPVAAMVCRAGAEISYVNPAFVALFGYSLADVSSIEAWWPLAYPDADYRSEIQTRWAEELARAAAGKVVGEPFEAEVLSKGGRRVRVRIGAVPLGRDWQGELLISFVDLTDMYQQQADFMLREARYRTLFESADVSIWNEDMSALVRHMAQLRADGVSDLAAYLDAHPDALPSMLAMMQVIEVNPATEKLFGGGTQAFLDGFGQLFGDGTLDVVREELLAFWAGEHSFASEVNLRSLSGRAIRALLSFPIPQSEDEARSVPVSIHDISRRHELERELLTHSQMLQNMQEGVLLVQLGDGLIVNSNPRGEALFGYGEGALVGMVAAQLRAPDTLEPEPWLGAPHWQGELLYRRADGTTFWALTSVSAFAHPAYGDVLVMALQDISLAMEAQQQLSLTTAELAAVTRIQGEFIERQDERQAFRTVLDESLKLTGSALGFVGEVIQDERGWLLKVHAASSGSDDYEVPRGTTMVREGSELRDTSTLAGAPLELRQILIENRVRRGRFKPIAFSGCAALESFAAIPVFHREELVGVMGLANREAGYAPATGDVLEPLLTTFAQLIGALRARREYRQTSEALRQAEERWKFAIEGAGHGIWDWDLVAQTISYSSTWCSLLGYEANELSASEADWEARIHPEDRTPVIRALERHLAGKSPAFVSEHRLACRDGSYKWVLGRGMVIQRDGDGHALRLIGTHTDISERKATEMALLANRAQLAGMIDTAMDAIVTTDKQFRIILFNRSAELMFGYPAHRMLGEPLDKLIPVRHAPHHGALMREFAHQGEATRRMGDPTRRQVAGLRSDGSEFPIEVAISYSDNYGHPIFTAMVRDITERRAHEEELLQFAATLEQRVAERTQQLEAARDDAEQANRAKSAFLANMSHEIRTPLNSVIGMAQLALGNAEDVRQRDYLQKIALSGNHLLHLIDDVLDFSKIEAGRFELDRTDFSLYDLLDELRQLMEARANERQLRLEIRRQPGLPDWLYGDALRLRQVLLNLLSNAIKFTAQGYITLRAASEPCAHGMRVHFSVEDSGVGISAEAQARLFQSFQQADSSTTRRYGGTGLGLAISYQLVQLMGGTLRVRSQPNFGSEFSFELTLPLAHVSERPVEPVVDFAAILRGRKVLVADDHPFNQQVATELLEAVGIDVTVAADGVQALRCASEASYDAILLDVQMPEMDGYEVCRELRRRAEYADVPILAMTANVSMSDRRQCLAAGMNDFIGKPVHAERLYRALALAIQGLPPSGESAPASVAEEGAINMVALRAGLGDDPERQARFCSRFAAAMREGVAELQRSDTSERQTLAHKLKSIARTVGAIRLGDALAALESGEVATLDDVVRHYASAINAMTELGLLSRVPWPVSSESVMLVDDDEFALDVLQHQLAELGYRQLMPCLCARDALKALDDGAHPAWIFCDLQMPDLDGVAFLRELGVRHYNGHVVILSGLDNPVLKATERLAQSFDLDLRGVLSKPAKSEALGQMLGYASVAARASPNAPTEVDGEPLSESELREGFASGALELYYQPKVSTRDGRVVGAECLARWHHPVRGLVGPHLFVPAIEALGLTDELTYTVLRLAAQQLERWQTAGAMLHLSVNVSMDNLHQLDLPERFSAILAEFGIAPESLTLEITETQIAHDYVLSLDILTRLRIKGFGLSIDDFGTGFSTMEHLMQTPFTELKIDRAFVRGVRENESAQTILEHSARLGARFSLNLVAEGVETQEDWDAVVAVGCHEVQGFFVARPMPADALLNWKSEWESAHSGG
ncbi:PAS domain S-box protein [Chitinibacteraceae bacterium HSL-7]